MNHVVTDGLGAIQLICGLADNYNKKLFPAVMTKPLELKYKILIELLTPFYALVILYRILIVLKPVNTIFKTEKPISGSTLVALSDKIDFKHYNHINKYLKISFNDLIASAVASAFKNFSRIVSDSNNIQTKKIPPYMLMVTPVGLTTLPKNLDNFDLCNNTTGLGNKIKLVDDEKEEIEIVSHDFGKVTRNVYLAKATKKLTDVMFNYLPYYIARLVIKNFCNNCDITISNVPGPRENLVYCGSKVLDIIPITTTGFSHVFTGILSYSGHFRIIVCFDKSLQLDPNQFLKCIDHELKKFSENHRNYAEQKKNK